MIVKCIFCEHIARFNKSIFKTFWIEKESSFGSLVFEKVIICNKCFQPKLINNLFKVNRELAEELKVLKRRAKWQKLKDLQNQQLTQKG